MAEQTRMRPAKSFVALSLAIGVGAGLGGLAGCSSGSAGSGTDDTGPASDAEIGCTGDSGTEEFTSNLTHRGDSGSLSFVIAGANFTPPAVDNNTWTLKILDASGQPVKDAVLTLPPGSGHSDPWMPLHTHGALAAKAVNNNDGTYTVAPLYFFMGGVWSTYIQAQTGSVTDSTTFTFCVGS
jgi:hypothetical protein